MSTWIGWDIDKYVYYVYVVFLNDSVSNMDAINVAGSAKFLRLPLFSSSNLSMSSCMYQQHQRKLAASSKTLYHELKAREYGSRRHDRDGGVQRLYEFVTPNKTYYDVAIDSVCYHIRRFTDDGKVHDLSLSYALLD